MPNTTVLQELVDGLRRGEFSLSELAKETDIPLTTLADMRKPNYGSKLEEQITKLEKVGKAIRRLRSRKARRRNGEAAHA